MRTKVPAISLGVALSLGAVTGTASAEVRDIAPPASLTVDQHGRVVMSTMRHCKEEDGSGGRLPCTWNVGPKYHLSDGASLWYDRHTVNSRGDHVPHYVWNRDPMQGHPHRHWLTVEQARKWPGSTHCWRRVGDTTTIGCPNGHKYTS
jgi:hypothetical protein